MSLAEMGCSDTSATIRGQVFMARKFSVCWSGLCAT